MALYFYIDKNGQQAGPVEANALPGLGVGPDTYVWAEGMPDWVFAKNVPALAYLFESQGSPYPPQNPNAYGQPNYGQPYGQPAYGYQQPQQPQLPCPPTYLVWSIIITLCCCLVGGIVAIVYSTQVESAWRSGDYALALKRSNQAKNWCIWSAVAGVVISIIYGATVAFTGLLSSL